MSDYIKREWRRLPFSARAALLMLIPALCLGLTLTALAWDTDLDGFEDGMDSNPVSRAVIPWGAPELVTNDSIVGYPWPGWLLAAFKTNGEWRTNPAAWHVPAAASNDTGWLNIEVDRTILTNDVMMETHWVDATGAVLYVDLYDAGGSLVVTNVYTSNLLAGSGTDVVRNVSVPLESHPDAVGIRLRRVAGEVTVFESMLYVDQDGDGLDAEQERQLGTSDHNLDFDGDGYPDYLEVFGYGTDPANATSFPTVTVSGMIAYAGGQGGMIRVVAVTSAGSWTSTAQTTLAEPGAYTLSGVPLLGNVWIKAWRDSNGNAAPEGWEAWGAHPGPLQPPADLTGINLALADPDSDGDGLRDWLELYLGADPGVSNAYRRLPFVERFETNTVQAGPLDGQNHWEAAPTNQVLVQTNAVPPGVGGVQALRLTTGSADLGAARHLFVAPTGEVVWLDCHVTAIRSAALTGPVETSAALYFDGDGRLTVHDGLRPAGTEWVALTNHAPVADGQWVRLTLGLDYGTGRWLVGLDGARVAQGLGFSRAWPGFMAVKFEANEQAVDNLTVAGTIPADLDLDGNNLPDAWELQHFGAIDQSPTGDGDHDGMSNVQEYEAGTDPSAADSDQDGVDDLTELLWNRDPHGTDMYATLPWGTDFETEQGCTNGELGGQQGWIVMAGTATVQSAVSYSNAQAVALRADASGLAVAGKLFASVTNPVVWSDYRLKPGAGAALPVDLPARATAVFGVNTQRFWACRSGSSWVVATNAAVATEAWAHVTLREDFLTRRWDLYVGRDAVLTNLLFADADADHFARFAFIGWGVSETYLDCLNLGANPPGHIDMDGDGLSNDEERPLGTNPANADTDLDGMDDRTELQRGYDPLASNRCVRIGANSDTNTWITGFEPSEGYGVDPLDGQNGWLASVGVTVVDSERHAGAQAVAVPPAAGTGAVQVMRADIGAAGQTVGWVTLYLKGADGLPDTDADASQSAVIGLYAGRLHAFDGVSGAWVASGRTFAADSNGWVRVDLRLDYRARQYLVYVNGLLALERVNFRNAGNSALSRFAVAGAAVAGATAYVDDVRLSAAEPAGVDYDEDGLDNVQEHQLGTNPGNSDTDGDGLSDFDEVNLYHTNPLDLNSYPTASISGIVSYGGPQTGVVHVVAVTESNSWDATWSTTIAAPGAYNISGIKLLSHYWINGWRDSNSNNAHDTGEAEGACATNPFYLSSNGVVGVDITLADRDTDATGLPDWWQVKYFGVIHVDPFGDADGDGLLNSEEHTFGTDPTRADSNGNGVSDYEEYRMQVILRQDPVAPNSLVSPVCVEGPSRGFDLLSAARTDMPGGMPEPVAIQHGAGDRWYADVRLSPTNATQFVITAGTNQVAYTNLVEWTPLNLLLPSSPTVTIRRGDALLFTAYPADATNGAVGIEVVGVTNYQTTVDSPVPHQFTEAGTFTVQGTYAGTNQITNSIIVSVWDASFGEDPACWVARVRNWECPALQDGLVVDHDLRIHVLHEAALPDGRRQFELWTDRLGTFHWVARLFPGGPILTNAVAQSFTIFSATETALQVVDTTDQGDEVVAMPVVMAPLLQNVTIRMTAFVGGVTFEDGTVFKEVSAADFDSTGETVIRFLHLAPACSSTCHTMSAWQNGMLIGWR